MKPKSAKEKGKRAERELAELMTKLSGVKYVRVPMSGALHQTFPFDCMKIGQQESIFDGIGNECKNTEKILVPDWIQQLKIACEDAGMSTQFSKMFIAFKHKGEFWFLLNQRYFEHLNEVKKLSTDST